MRGSAPTMDTDDGGLATANVDLTVLYHRRSGIELQDCQQNMMDHGEMTANVYNSLQIWDLDDQAPFLFGAGVDVFSCVFPILLVIFAALN